MPRAYPGRTQGILLVDPAPHQTAGTGGGGPVNAGREGHSGPSRVTSRESVTGTGASRDCALLRCTAGCACAVLCDSAFSLPGRRRRRRPPRHRWQRCAALEPAPLPLPGAGSLCMPSLHTELLFILQSPLSTATASGRPFLLLLTRLCVLRGMARSPVPPTYPAPGPSLGSLPLQRLQKSDICFPSLPCSYEWSQDMVLANEAQG